MKPSQTNKPISSISVFLSLFLLALCMHLSSCSKSDTAPAKSRVIKFEVTSSSSAAVDLSISYITASGGATVESVTSLPWIKEITYAQTASATSLTAGGTASPGTTITIKMSAGGKLESTTPATASSAGVVVVTSPSYIF